MEENKNFFEKYSVLFLKKLELGSSLAVRLRTIHPKHLVKIEEPWYLKYLKKTDRVLDLGCGNGQHTLRIAVLCQSVIGVEKDKRQLEIAKKGKRKLKCDNARFVQRDLERKLQFQNNSFDVIMLLDVLEHLENRQQLMKEIKRVSKKNGRLLLSVPNKETSWKRRQRRYGVNSFADKEHKIEYSRAEIINFCRQNGFLVKKIMPVTFDTPLAGLFDLIGGFSLSAYRFLALWKRKKVREKPTETTGFRLVCRLV